MTATTQLPQHMQALQRAQRIRLARSALRSNIAPLTRIDGLNRVAGLLLYPPESIETLPIAELLCWARNVGRTQARGILRSADPIGMTIGEKRRVGDLSQRQRTALVQFIDRQVRGT